MTSRKSWKEHADRLDGSEDYQFGDLTRGVGRSLGEWAEQPKTKQGYEFGDLFLKKTVKALFGKNNDEKTVDDDSESQEHKDMAEQINKDLKQIVELFEENLPRLKRRLEELKSKDEMDAVESSTVWRLNHGNPLIAAQNKTPMQLYDQAFEEARMVSAQPITAGLVRVGVDDLAKAVETCLRLAKDCETTTHQVCGEDVTQVVGTEWAFNRDMFARAPDLRKRVVLHRGWHRLERDDTSRPLENTRQAYLDAAQMGVAYAECDVWMTKDGVAVLSHDFNFKWGATSLIEFAGNLATASLDDVVEELCSLNATNRAKLARALDLDLDLEDSKGDETPVTKSLKQTPLADFMDLDEDEADDADAVTPIRELAWDTLQKLELLDGSNPVKLETVLDDLRESSTRLVVEIKCPTLAASLGVYLLDNRHLVPSIAWVMSFSLSTLEQFSHAGGEQLGISTMWLLDNASYRDEDKNEGETTFDYSVEDLPLFLTRLGIKERVQQLQCGLYIQYRAKLIPEVLEAIRKDLVNTLGQKPGSVAPTTLLGLWTDIELDPEFDRSDTLKKWGVHADVFNTDLPRSFWVDSDRNHLSQNRLPIVES